MLKSAGEKLIKLLKVDGNEISISEVKHFLKTNNEAVIINYAQKNGTTPLAAALSCNVSNKAILKLLLNLGADPNQIVDNKTKCTPIMMLLDGWYLQERISMAKILLEGGADPDKRNDRGENALSWAIAHEASLNYVKMLIRHGANVNVPIYSADDKCFYSALSWAVKMGSSSIAKVLLQNGADPNVQDEEGRTPLFEIGCHREIKLLLDYGADPDHRNKFGNTFIESILGNPYSPNNRLGKQYLRTVNRLKINKQRELTLKRSQVQEQDIVADVVLT